jgi:hypothetical protein
LKWRTRIVKCCEAAGTYKDYFVPVIDTLAEILDKRDAAQHEFIESGARLMIVGTNKAGNTYYTQNPLIRMINDLNRDALTYWKELGLTAASLRKINEAAIKGGSELSALDKALMELGG